jgi:hypothetical protein
VDAVKGIATHLAHGADSGELTVDRLLNTASSLGVRLYTIEAQGLVSSLDSASPSFEGSYGANNATIPSTLRVRQAQDTLGSMAAETGGRAFLNGIPAGKIVSGIETDLSCVFVVSFDPTGLPEDRPLPVIVKVNRSGIKVRGRGRLLIESESARKTSRLLAAFANAGEAPADSPLHVSVVPSGFRDGSFSGLVQVSVPPSPYPNASWDLGFSIVGGEKVRDAVSTRMSVAAPNSPIVLEREVRFPPGPFEIVAVGRETSTEQIASRQVEGSWPLLRDEAAAVGPVLVMQPMSGAFQRGDEVRKKGPVALGESDAVRGDLPTAFVALVCRGKEASGTVRVERKLTGESGVSFKPIEIDKKDDECAQTRDLVRAGTLGPGSFVYEVRILAGDKEIARGERKFHVAETAD